MSNEIERDYVPGCCFIIGKDLLEVTFEMRIVREKAVMRIWWKSIAGMRAVSAGTRR